MASEANRMIAKDVADTFNGQPKVFQHHDTSGSHSVHVAARVDCPTPGVNSYSTLGLSDSPLMLHGKEYPNTRVEILAACDGRVEYFRNAMSTIAFCVIKGQWFCGPGRVFMDILNLYDRDAPLPHIYFTTPFLWGKYPDPKQHPGKVVSFVQAMPISESERRYILQHGDNALETLFEKNEIDVCDLRRQPVV